LVLRVIPIQQVRFFLSGSSVSSSLAATSEKTYLCAKMAFGESMGQEKVVIGLTGAVGAGKTTVAKQFGKLGCAVISADVIDHQVLERAAVAEELEQWWGPEILEAGGKVDRNALGNIVFEDSKEMKRLTDLVHPLILERQKALIREYQDDGSIKAIVLDVPLLFEVGQQGMCDSVVFVGCEEDLRVQRLQENRGWERDRIKKIENLQFGLDIKATMSDHRVDNNSTILALADSVAKIFSLILETQAARQSRMM
jgi:dephospho-CoA kinase